MRHLRYLDLGGNPLAEETGYRLLVVKNLPWLATLDMHKVTRSQRVAPPGGSDRAPWQAANPIETAGACEVALSGVYPSEENCE